MFSVCPHLGGGSGLADWGGSGPAGGVSGQYTGGGVRYSQWGGSSQRGVRSSQRGGVSILRPLVGGMPLAFMQEDFLVSFYNE